MKLKGKIIISVLIIAGALLGSAGCLGYKAEIGENTIPTNKATNVSSNILESEYGLITTEYVRAKDGDTLVVKKDGKEVTIRLIGIDTPESVHPDQNKNTKEGESASEYTKNLLKDIKTLYLEYDINRTDKYGRDLAYVWLSPDKTDCNNMLNYKLVKDGIAVAKEYKPNVKYSEVLKSAK